MEMTASRRWRSLAIIGVLVATIAVAACSGNNGGSASDSSGSGAETAPPAAGDFDPNGVLRVGAPLQLVSTLSLDPRVSSISGETVWLSALYAPLMRYTPSTGEFTPYLAESVTTIDPKTVSVAIRPNAVFDNGQQMTAADAKATIDAMKANQAGGKAPGIQAGIQIIDSIEIVNDKTFVVHMARDGLGVIYELLSGRESYIVPASAGASQNTAPIGTGAFKFESYIKGQKLKFTKSKTFFDQANVRLAGLELLNLTEGTPQQNALLAGDIDITSGSAGGGLDPAGLAVLARNRKFRTLTVPGNNFTYVDMCKAPGYILSDVRVRQALQYGTDRAALAKAIYGDESLATTQEWAKGSPFYNPDLDAKYAYDPQKAKDLIKQAGVEGGTIRLIWTTTDPTTQNMALLVQQQWSQLGLKVQITQTDDSVGDFFLPALSKSVKHDVFFAPFVRTPSTKLSLMFAPHVQRNVCGFEDPKILTAIEQLQGLNPTTPEAAATWKSIADYVASIAAIIPSTLRPQLVGYSDKVGGVTADTGATGGTVSLQYTSLYIRTGP